MNRYVIIVSRDRPDLWETLAIACGQRGRARFPSIGDRGSLRPGGGPAQPPRPIAP